MQIHEYYILTFNSLKTVLNKLNKRNPSKPPSVNFMEVFTWKTSSSKRRYGVVFPIIALESKRTRQYKNKDIFKNNIFNNKSYLCQI